MAGILDEQKTKGYSAISKSDQKVGAKSVGV